jgi:N-acetyl sugar amidotransferase
MQYCQRCLYPANHPLGIVFDDDGVCSGCRIHEEKDELDWPSRAERLRRIFEEYRSKTERTFDCIVPVSGARDSYFIVHTVKESFGMKPLLVNYNKHYNTHLGIRNLAYLRTLFDSDFVQVAPSPEVLKRITRNTVDLMGSIYWHILAGQSVFPVQTAVRLKIPLIVWGFHQGLEQVGMFSHLDEVEMTRKYRKDHDLMGFEAEDLLAQCDDLSVADLEQFIYPQDKELEKVGVRGIYLDNYLRWDSKSQHEKMFDMYGYETLDQHRTFDRYMHVDCMHYAGLHDYTKYLKWGYGLVTDHASREIRLRRMTREQGIEMVRRYQDVRPHDEKIFLDWLEMSACEFYRHVDKHRDPRIWNRDEDGNWQLNDSVQHHVSDPGVDSAAQSVLLDANTEFMLVPPKDSASIEFRQRILARGWVDAYS